jgi:hypothetical protein
MLGDDERPDVCGVLVTPSDKTKSIDRPVLDVRALTSAAAERAMSIAKRLHSMAGTTVIITPIFMGYNKRLPIFAIGDATDVERR